MSREREFLKKLRYASLLENDLRKELEELLAQLEQEPKFNFDLERMKAAIESPISDVTVEDLMRQVKQEPVAWMSINNNGGISIDNYYANHKDYVPLYLAPPKRRPLTDEEIYSIGNKYAFHAAVREIERIHGIGI